MILMQPKIFCVFSSSTDSPPEVSWRQQKWSNSKIVTLHSHLPGKLRWIRLYT
jgi:hypothetical protein